MAAAAGTGRTLLAVPTNQTIKSARKGEHDIPAARKDCTATLDAMANSELDVVTRNCDCAETTKCGQNERKLSRSHE